MTIDEARKILRINSYLIGRGHAYHSAQHELIVKTKELTNGCPAKLIRNAGVRHYALSGEGFELRVKLFRLGLDECRYRRIG